MKYVKEEKTIVDYAQDILFMHNELRGAKREIQRLQKIEKEYLKLLDNSIKHSDIMMTNLLKATLTKKSA